MAYESQPSNSSAAIHRLENVPLIEARKKLGLYAREVAAKVGVSTGIYYHYEMLKALPVLETQDKIIGFFKERGIYLAREEVFPDKARGIVPRKKHYLAREIPLYLISRLKETRSKDLPCSSSPERKVGLNGDLEKLLGTIPEQEKNIVRLKLYEDKTYDEIGKILHLTGARVQQIYWKAIRDLRRRCWKGTKYKSLRAYTEG